MKLNDKNLEHNDSNHETDAQLDELIEIGKNMISISADVLLHSLEESQKRNEINKMQKQINYLKTELEKLRKKN
ncbi:hypothetical protein DTX80_08080 [Bacilli bacterium]|uniref:hypothetical protein n=1 Tax=Bacillaceae TaxID=186817 RepID=UPI000621DD13|nr:MULTISPECIES: hypothetical protein [Bacillus amyloliquefaciens group]KKE78927.1 hypothetical protein WH51_10115 [Bacilli bacterium VT-13-104]PZD86077.1 hypothetical protein DEJ64_08270 [Bacilli bacterium]ASF27889.1 hypothetical protein WV34_03490 [Bacillus amyloliquefaciens]PZD89375.1 hypothetical protein DEJ60_05015 [Bacilli bacterium]PZD90249.1 hypothetical protein DEJ66_10130 [Bacilli bacterium]